MPSFLNQHQDWQKSHESAYKAFMSQTSHVAAVQSTILSETINKNRNTEYGKKYNFTAIKNYADYARLVPLIEDYSQLEEEINSILSGTQNVLTQDSVLFAETTSGNTGSKKFIPYTSTLLSEFRQGISTWLYDLYNHHPKTNRGKAYWSLSPPLKDDLGDSPLKIGIDNDLEYFSSEVQESLSHLLLFPDYRGADPDLFYKHVWRSLCAASEELTFISIWSPTYILQLHRFLLENYKDLGLNREHEIIIYAISNNQATWKDLFPNLSLVSCWVDGNSSLWIDELKRIINIPIQGKGLLATEGITTIPLANQSQVLAFTSHFYEFRDISEKDNIVLAEDLQPGRKYEVILTTGGGLYRYCTKDIVLIEGFFHSVPKLRFVEKRETVSDYVGEKISATTFATLVKELKNELSIFHIFLHPIRVKSSVQYQLLILTDEIINIDSIRNKVEHYLLSNPYYNQAIKLGQLLKLEAIKLNTTLFSSILKRYQSRNKIKDGDMKIPLILPIDLCTDLIND